jgi:hypothetical protein
VKINATFSALNLAARGAVPATLNMTARPGVCRQHRHLGDDVPRASGFACPRGNSGYSYFLDGKSNAGKFDGTLRLDPTQSPDGKSDTEGQFRPITFKSKVTGSFEKIDLSEIEIRPADAADQGTILSGTASFILDKQIKATADFSAPRVDFDALVGAGARRLLRDGGGLSLVNGLLAALPEAVDLRSSIKFAALKTGGEVTMS